jgi:exosortase/archaeosortase family protein
MNKSVRIALLTDHSDLGLGYLFLRLMIFDLDPLIPFLNSLYMTYLFIPEWIANNLFSIINAGVSIEDHRLVYEQTGPYQESYSTFIDNWPKYLLHKLWSLLVMVAIWSILAPVKRKIQFTILFVLVHILSVVAGLYLMGVTGPKIVDADTVFFLTPTLAGNLLMFILFLIWVFINKKEIRNTLQKLGIRVKLSDRKMNEILAALFFLVLLRDYLIPFPEYRLYVRFLLEITQWIASLIGFEGYIVGDQLVGANGALALAKHCLGIMTMYVFASMVYLTRPGQLSRISWLFIAGGTFFIFISNIARLVLVFVVAQGENGYHRASMHHEIYNVGIYVFIFIIWIAWFEMIRRRSDKLSSDEH